MSDNDVIKENMAPYPIYVVMLCTMWRESDDERRQVIRSLQTFSHLFREMIDFLISHYISKHCTSLDKGSFEKDVNHINQSLLQIGYFALSGLLNNDLVLDDEAFNDCPEALEDGCKVGVLTREEKFVPRAQRYVQGKLVCSEVLFPHKLFQEYLASSYLASLFKNDRASYEKYLHDCILPSADEFRYLLYFTSSHSDKEIGSDIVARLSEGEWLTHIETFNDFLVDITFECHHRDVGKRVAKKLYQHDKTLSISENMSAHTMSGYLFITDVHEMVCIFSNPTVTILRLIITEKPLCVRTRQLRYS